MNKLYYGDNLTIMQRHLKAASVDLIYLDPPFNSQQNYNLLYKTLTGKPVPEQADAFCDTWEMDAQKEELAKRMPAVMTDYGIDDFYIQFWNLWIRALRNTQPKLLAYLIYMVIRLLHMRVILKPTGSIYLHCDPTASHYIKVMMDGIFGHRNFRNEIIWKRTSAHSSAKRYGPVHDVILFYGKGEEAVWIGGYQAYDEEYLKQRFARGEDRPWKDADLTGAGTRNGETGKPWRGFDVTAKGRHWAYPPADLDRMDSDGLIYWPKKQGAWPRQKKFLDEAKGVPLQDVWTDIPPLNSQAGARLGYPTQKPTGLLERIIRASTPEGSVIFDPFCGCGTTIYAAENCNRQWIGCDIAILAVKLIRETLAERYHLVEDTHFEVDGIPLSAEAAHELFLSDPFQFQHWAVERAGGFPMQRKSKDRGIDGRIYFEAQRELKDMVISVKGGAVHPTDVRDLRGVLEREQASELAGLITQKPVTKGMREEASTAGQYTYNGVNYDRIQFLTVREMLEEKREFHTPARIVTRMATGQQSLPL
jgi:DNA modification methylase